MTLANDPNGIDLPDWKKFGYASYEQFIEEKAGQSPPDLAGIPVELDENVPRGEIHIKVDGETVARIRSAEPEPEIKVYWGDPTETADEFYETQRKAQEILDQGQADWLRWNRERRQAKGDWPMPPGSPTTPPDDEALEVPDE